MAALRVLCWALIFILRLQFPPGSPVHSYVLKVSTHPKESLHKNGLTGNAETATQIHRKLRGQW